MKRRIVILILLLILGAIVNIATAWGCAILSHVELRSRLVDEPNDLDQLWWNEHRTARAPHVVTAVWRMSGTGLDSRMMLAAQSGAVGFHTSDGQTTFGAMMNDLFDLAQEVRSGWPARSLRGTVWSYDVTLAMPLPMLGQSSPDLTLVDMQTGAVSFNRPAWLGGSSYRVLPLKPEWWGFGSNTIFYASLLWLLWFAPFTARRMLRRRRGLCEQCAYPIGESPVCTECGAVVRRS